MQAQSKLWLLSTAVFAFAKTIDRVSLVRRTTQWVLLIIEIQCLGVNKAVFPEILQIYSKHIQ